MEFLVSACFESEDAERKRQVGRNGQTYGVCTGNEQAIWMGPSQIQPSQYAENNVARWEQQRTGRCMERQEGYARCGSPQSKLNSMAQPVLGTDRAQIFLEKLAPGTRKGYWCAWKQWEMFREQRQQSERIDVNGGPNWDEAFIEFLLFHHKIMQRKAGTFKTKAGAVRYFHVIHGNGVF